MAKYSCKIPPQFCGVAVVAEKMFRTEADAGQSGRGLGYRGDPDNPLASNRVSDPFADRANVCPERLLLGEEPGVGLHFSESSSLAANS